MQERRVIRPRPRKTDPANFSGLHPVLARVYAGRNLGGIDDINHGLDRLLPPDLSGIEKAADIVATAVQRGNHILIVGDYDADGATSCAVAVRALDAMGASRVSYLVPNRFEYGYGLTPEIVRVAKTMSPDLVVTVDNGIASIDGVKTARELGMEVVITDHHLPGQVLPDAHAIVNPNQPGDPFPSKYLAGVGVIFYLMIRVRQALRHLAWFAKRGISEPSLAELLDLVALGTVADLVPLDHNNRILVAQGLARINRGLACAGIRALLAVSGRKAGRITATDLGFAIGPRLNAAGRLEDMSLGIACLVAHDDVRAMELATKLDGLNRERRAIQQAMEAEALEDVADLVPVEREVPLGLCLYRQEWHPGVVGLVASRIKEAMHRPVIAFAPDGEEFLRGSARSIQGVHIRDVLDEIATRHPGLINKFGGHAMAAGLSLPRLRLDDFEHAFQQVLARYISEEDLQGVIYTDGPLSADDIDIHIAEQLSHAGPWGQGFPEPVFENVFRIQQAREVGKNHLKLTLQLENAPTTVEAIAFDQANLWTSSQTLIRAAYRLHINEYRGWQNVQLVVEYFEAANIV